MARGRSLQGIIEHDEYRQDFLSTPTGPSFEMAEMAEMPTPESRGRRQTPPVQQQLEPTKVKTEQNAGHDALDFSNDNSPAPVSSLNNKPAPILTSDQVKSGSSSPTRLALSPRRMSISDLNLEPGIEASIEETNVTLDDIAQYIEGPDPVDNKWVCKFDDCNKKFGRKENIKSHVQTHLGDRQFRCDHCKKCFVRGHDLKRHAKIHTGTKPYPCLCGNSFARHDALTRHRQRGMCIGAFDGVVKKVIKRGRPRKHRPEMDDRLDKAGRTRQKLAELQDSYTSSASSCSMSSWGSPPTENFESLSIRGTSPYESMPLFAVAPQDGTLDPMMSFPPENFSFTPPASPGYSTGNKPSPNYRELTPAELGEIAGFQTSTSSQMLPELPVMGQGLPLMGMVNGLSLPDSGHSLPSLSHSSSSPAADVVVFDFSDLSAGGLSSATHTSQLPMKLESDRNEFDTFLDYASLDMGLDPSNQDFFANLS
jgi:regulatory protein SWI5